MTSPDKLFGMNPRSGRWVFIALGLGVSICLGAVYAYSVFKTPLEDLFGASATQSNLPFMVFLAVFALFTFIAGRFVEVFGPRRVMAVGGLVVGSGWILTMFAPSMTSVVLTYGIIGGAGVGIVYGCPIAVATRWFPDRKGFAVGLTILGFGISAVVTAPLARALIASLGPLKTFGIMGAGIILVIVLLSQPMRFPTPGWKPEGWIPPESPTKSPTPAVTPSQMIRTPAFKGLYLCFTIGTTAGLMAIGISASVGREVIGLGDGAAAGFVSFFALFNGGGRPLFGWLTDRIGPRKTAVLSFALIFLASLGMLASGPGKTVLYAACFACFWLCLGGWLALSPAATAAYFGVMNHAKNYGLMFSAYGVGAILGGLISGNARDVFGSYRMAFGPTAALAVVGIILALTLLKPPSQRNR
ncbi:MAG: OFA family MFS transporter [Acidobacteriota bacterium]|nr:OFA family MFS transporter [Acidobacteriota bacterium]